MNRNGEVEASRSVTVQLKAYHPVQVSLSLRLPIEDGESAIDAAARVSEMVAGIVDDQVNDLISTGWKYGDPTKR